MFNGLFNLWLFDKGATHHFTHNITLFHDFSSLSSPLEVKFGDNGTKLGIRKGTIHLPINQDKIVSISNVYYVPGLARNLLPVGEAKKMVLSLNLIEIMHQSSITYPQENLP